MTTNASALEPRRDGAPVDESSNSRSLLPGSYLVELRTTRPLAQVDLEDGLELLGWSGDQNGPPVLDLASGSTDQQAHRFVGTWSSGRRLDLVDDDPFVRWSYATRLAFDPFADVTRESRPFCLEPNATYALRFLSRVKAQPTRENVEDVMRNMGFVSSIISCVRRNTHLRGRPDVTCALWCGVARWTGARTVHTIEDPISVEDAVLVVEEER